MKCVDKNSESHMYVERDCSRPSQVGFRPRIVQEASRWTLEAACSEKCTPCANDMGTCQRYVTGMKCVDKNSESHVYVERDCSRSSQVAFRPRIVQEASHIGFNLYWLIAGVVCVSILAGAYWMFKGKNNIDYENIEEATPL